MEDISETEPSFRVTLLNKAGDSVSLPSVTVQTILDSLDIPAGSAITVMLQDPEDPASSVMNVMLQDAPDPEDPAGSAMTVMLQDPEDPEGSAMTVMLQDPPDPEHTAGNAMTVMLQDTPDPEDPASSGMTVMLRDAPDPEHLKDTSPIVDLEHMDKKSYSGLPFPFLPQTVSVIAMGHEVPPTEDAGDISEMFQTSQPSGHVSFDTSLIVKKEGEHSTVAFLEQTANNASKFETEQTDISLNWMDTDQLKTENILSHIKQESDDTENVLQLEQNSSNLDKVADETFPPHIEDVISQALPSCTPRLTTCSLKGITSEDLDQSSSEVRSKIAVAAPGKRQDTCSFKRVTRRTVTRSDGITPEEQSPTLVTSAEAESQHILYEDSISDSDTHSVCSKYKRPTKVSQKAKPSNVLERALPCCSVKDSNDQICLFTRRPDEDKSSFHDCQSNPKDQDDSCDFSQNEDNSINTVVANYKGGDIQSKNKVKGKSKKSAKENKTTYTCICEKCGKALSSRPALITHKKLHLDSQDHKSKCPICQKAFTQPGNLKMHIRAVHEKIKAFVCELCNKSFSQRCGLNYHMTVHRNDEYKSMLKEPADDTERKTDQSSGSDMLHCLVCSYSVVKINSWVCHTKNHLLMKDITDKDKLAKVQAELDKYESFMKEETAKTCRTCGKLFATQGLLESHMSVHTGKRKFKCRFCSSTFLNWSHRDAHEQYHTKKFKFVCDVCEQGFPRSNALAVHKKRVHNEVSPAELSSFSVCEECSIVFAYPSALQIHMSTVHHKEKKHPCSKCGKMFGTKYALNIHKRTHTQERPYECPVCHRKFTDPSNLIHHGQKVHPEHPASCFRQKKRIQHKHDKLEQISTPSEPVVTESETNLNSISSDIPTLSALSSENKSTLQLDDTCTIESLQHSLANAIPSSMHNAIPSSIHNAIPSSIPSSIHNAIPSSNSNLQLELVSPEAGYQYLMDSAGNLTLVCPESSQITGSLSPSLSLSAEPVTIPPSEVNSITNMQDILVKFEEPDKETEKGDHTYIVYV